MRIRVNVIQTDNIMRGLQNMVTAHTTLMERQPIIANLIQIKTSMTVYDSAISDINSGNVDSMQPEFQIILTHNDEQIINSGNKTKEGKGDFTSAEDGGRWKSNCSNTHRSYKHPKIDNPSNMRDLRPIALCNVIYKILAKVLANRLGGVIDKIISEEQSGFVPGKSLSQTML